MIRIQIQITEAQAVALRQLAALRRQSVAERIRTSVDLFIKTQTVPRPAFLLERAKSAAGRFASGSSTGGSEHDRHLADAFGER